MIIWVIIFAVICGLLSIENLIWGQFMFSRPIIFIPLLFIITELFFPIPFEYKYLMFGGAIMIEFFSLFALPIGSSFSPDTSISGVMFYLFSIYLIKSDLIIGIDNWAFIFTVMMMFSITFSFFGSYFEIMTRRFNSVLVEYSKTLLLELNFKRFESMNKWGYIIFFFKNFIQVILYFFFFAPLLLLILNISVPVQINKILFIFLFGIIVRYGVVFYVKNKKSKVPLLALTLLLLLVFLISLSKVISLFFVIFLFFAYIYWAKRYAHE